MKIKALITDPSARKDRLLFLSAMLFLSGCIGGILAASVNKSSETPHNILFSGGLAVRCGSDTVFEILKNNFTGMALILIISMLLGLFAFGQILSVPMIGYRGFCFGSAVFLCVNEFGPKGLAAVLTMVIPYGIYSSVIVFLAARESAKNSNIILNFVFFGRAKEDMKKCVRLYFLRFIFLFIFTAAGIVIQTLLLYLTVKFIV